MPINKDDPIVKAAIDSYGTFFAAPDVPANMIVDTINDRQNQASFESDMSELVVALSNDEAALADFNKLFDDVGMEGIMQMYEAKPTSDNDHLIYHTAHGHIPEIMDDSEKETLNQLAKTFTNPSNQDAIANLLFANLAKAAAAWHDVVQKKGPPVNEIESAKAFEESMRAQLDKFQRKHAKFAPAIEKFKSHLNFISKELIISDTWLLWSMNSETKAVSAKTQGEYVNEVTEKVIQAQNKLQPEERTVLEQQGKLLKQSEPGAFMTRLQCAAKSISASDTSRFSLEHVLDPVQGQLLVKSLNSMTPELQAPLQAFFTQNGITAQKEQEQFMGLLAQNLRMFGELNMPAGHPAANEKNTVDIKTEDHQFFLDGMNSTREGLGAGIDYQKMLELFITTKSFAKNPGPPARENIVREQNFGKAQPQEIWHIHAARLAAFDQFVKAPENVGLLKALGECVVNLSTKFQPGYQLLQRNDSLAPVLAASRQTTYERLLRDEKTLSIKHPIDIVQLTALTEQINKFEAGNDKILMIGERLPVVATEQNYEELIARKENIAAKSDPTAAEVRDLYNLSDAVEAYQEEHGLESSSDSDLYTLPVVDTTAVMAAITTSSGYQPPLKVVQLTTAVQNEIDTANDLQTIVGKRPGISSS
jgi:hypothetical protein